MHRADSFHATTIVSVRRDGRVVMAATASHARQHVVKANARKLRRLGKDGA